jgi:Tfp pilus assembly protein PilX
MDKQDKDLRIVHDYIRGIPLTDYKDALAALNRADKRIAALESDNARLQQRADAAYAKGLEDAAQIAENHVTSELGSEHNLGCYQIASKIRDLGK